jgi:hypothetical protein
MRRADAIALIEQHRAEIAAFGVKSLSLFGSVARDEARDDSDIDVLVEFEGPVTFRGHFGLLEFLEDLTGLKIDLATPEMLRPEIRSNVYRDLLHVA